MRFEERLMALREGKVSFASVYNQTRNLWVYMADKLLVVRNPGIGVGREDVVQELLVGAWRAVGKWDPTRGVAIDRYVIFNSNANAAHWLDHQREASCGGKLSRNPTRAPMLGSRVDIGDSEVFARKMDPKLDNLLDVQSFLERVSLSVVERIVVEALCSTQSPRAAALQIYNHYPHRIRLELGCERAAVRLVQRVAARLCEHPALLSLLEEHHGQKEVRS